MQIPPNGASSSSAAAARASFFLSRLFALALALGDLGLAPGFGCALGDAFVGLGDLDFGAESPLAEAGFALALTCKYSHCLPFSQVPA